MSVECLVKIKSGSFVIQDQRFTNLYACLPPKYAEGHRVTANLDEIFIARKMIKKGKKVWWNCKRPGYRFKGNYGNGSILARDVEILSPMHLPGILKIPEEGK